MTAKVHVGKNKAGSYVCPLMVVNNVHPYAGVPSALRDTFQAFQVSLSFFLSPPQHSCLAFFLQHLYTCEKATPFLLKEVFFSVDEDRLSAVLAETQQEFSDSVQIGSYPEDSSR